MKKLIILIILLFASSAMSADYYITSAGAGNNDGLTWANAMMFSSFAPSRGNTYYVSGGSYTGRVFDTVASGTDVISIKKATTVECALANAPATCADQALFSTVVNFKTAYWVWDGVTGSGSDHTTYGFERSTPADCNSVNYSIAMSSGCHTTCTAGNITISHTAMMQCGSGYDFTQAGVYSVQDTPPDSVVISDNYFNNGSSNIKVASMTNATVSGNYFDGNWSSSGNHGQQIEAGGTASGWLLFNNTFKDSAVYVIGTHYTGNDGWKIYNNIVIGGSFTAVFGNADSSTADAIKQWEVHHNTVSGATCGSRGFLFVGDLSDQATNHSHAYNNLFYNSTTPIMSNAGKTADGIIHNYNAYIDVDSYTDEANKQTGTGNPFTDSAAGDYTLKSGTVPIDHGDTLAADYDDDKAGVTRPQGSAWDIGAYEYRGNISIMGVYNAKGMSGYYNANGMGMIGNVSN